MTEIELLRHPICDLWPTTWVIYLPECRMLAAFYNKDCGSYIIYSDINPQKGTEESSYLEFLIVLGMTEENIREFVRDKMGVYD